MHLHLDLHFWQRFMSALLVQLWICSGLIVFWKNRNFVYLKSTMSWFDICIHCERVTTIKVINMSVIRFNFNVDRFGGQETCRDWWVPTELYKCWLQRMPPEGNPGSSLIINSFLFNNTLFWGSQEERAIFKDKI